MITKPKSGVELLQNWIRLGPPTQRTVKRFIKLTDADPLQVEKYWNGLQEKGMLLLDKELNEAWLFRGFKLGEDIVTIADTANALYDGLCTTQLEDIAELVHRGMTVSQATTEIGVGDFAMTSVFDQPTNNCPDRAECLGGSHSYSIGDVVGKEQKALSYKLQHGKQKRLHSISIPQYCKELGIENKYCD